MTVGRPSRALRVAEARAAVHPLPPISEPQARALAEASVQADLHSPDPAVRSNAALVNVLAQLVLGSADPNQAAATPTS